MKALDIVHVMAGFFVITGVLLSVYVSSWWLILSGFVGLNLLQFGFTKACPMVWLLKKIGFEEQ